MFERNVKTRDFRNYVIGDVEPGEGEQSGSAAANQLAMH